MKIVNKLVILLIVGFIGCSIIGKNDGEIVKEANRIHNEVLTVDTHTDTPMAICYDNYDIAIRHESSFDGAIDLPRLKEGGIDAVFFAVWVGQGLRTLEGNINAKKKADEMIEAIYDAVDKNKNEAEIALTSEAAYQIEKNGKRAIYIGMENGYPLGNDISLVKEYYDKGVRYITLCHTSNNDICDSSTDSLDYSGLSEFGEKVVIEMQKIGMLVDISHTSDSTFYDVLKICKAPVIASHSNARAVCNNPRNLTDNMLKVLAKNGGVVQLCILSEYVKDISQDPKREVAFNELREKYNDFKNLTDEEGEDAWKEWREINKKFPEKLAYVKDLVNHIDHIVGLIGVDHVGIGTDFDGGGRLEDCKDVLGLRKITVELVKRGYSNEAIRKIWGGNFMRVFMEVEKLSEASSVKKG